MKANDKKIVATLENAIRTEWKMLHHYRRMLQTGKHPSKAEHWENCAEDSYHSLRSLLAIRRGTWPR